MHLRGSFIGACLPLAAALSLLPAAGEKRGAGAGITWKKTVLDKKFRAEGVAVADVNRDGKTDVLAGEVWYEAPDWKMHEIQMPGDYGDGASGYSHTFACWADDLNGDGWPDLIVIDYPGTPCYWLENPRGKPGHWPKHVIWHSACNETPQYADLFGWDGSPEPSGLVRRPVPPGKRVLVMAWQPKGKGNEGQLAYFTPGKDPTALWEMHPVSEPSRPGRPVPGTLQYSHGLGAGDVNGDGRPDVICTGGWWEQPGKPTGAPWKFHPADLGPDCADLFAYDLDNDGKPDILSSSAHRYGIWWHQQKPGPNGPTFLRHDLFPHLFSQTHALHFVDIDGDGLKDLVTGKRWWAHGPKGDADPNDPAKLYWFKARKNLDGFTTFEPREIDNDSGVGTQFTVADVNGDRAPDVVVANKKGVFLFEQMRGRR